MNHRIATVAILILGTIVLAIVVCETVLVLHDKTLPGELIAGGLVAIPGIVGLLTPSVLRPAQPSPADLPAPVEPPVLP